MSYALKWDLSGLPIFSVGRIDVDSSGEINSFIQNFKEPNIPLAYDYPEIILHATRFDDLTGNPTFPVFTMPNSYVYTTEALALGKNLVAERTTEETKITEPPILVSRQIVICRN
jgi:hypothetical protein